jgi:hypothetical protein
MKKLHFKKARKRAGRGLAAVALVLVTGCQGSPSINVLGSFFPGWMLCIGLGAAGTLVSHRLFVKAGIEPHLKPRPLVYFCLWLLITLVSWLLFFRS